MAHGRVRSSYVTAKAEMHGGLMFGLMLGSDDDGVDDELDDDDDDDADSGSFDYAAHDY